MNITDFIEQFKEQFENEPEVLSPAIQFRELEGWTSLTALLVITMIDDEYGVVLHAEEMRKTNTIQELFELVESKLK